MPGPILRFLQLDETPIRTVDLMCPARTQPIFPASETVSSMKVFAGHETAGEASVKSFKPKKAYPVKKGEAKRKPAAEATEP